MGSKRSKKSKQELEMFSEKRISESDVAVKAEIGSDFSLENNGVIPAVVPKAPKRKKKVEGVEEVPKKIKKTNDNEDKVKVKKRKTKSDSLTSEGNDENVQLPINGEVEAVTPKTSPESPDKKKEPITWPDEDIVELINRMETNIPQQDFLAYKSRVEKLNWENVSFKNYNAEACKKTWLQVQKRIRRFRLLREVLNDAKEWVNAPKMVPKLPRPRKHPDMPRRPLSSYLLFYLNKKDQILSENPGLDGSDITKIVGQIYKNLPPEKREKYEKMAASNREEYVEKLKIFFEKHPEFAPPQRMNHMFVDKDKVKIEKEKPLSKEKAPPKPEKEKAPKVEKVPKVEKEKPPRNKDRPKGKPGRPPKADTGERPPKKCQTPFGLFYSSELKSKDPGVEKNAFRETCKERYKQMSDDKKVVWINLAEQDLIRYQEEVKTYKAKYPDFQAHKVRSLLTKKEKASKERASGKPVKPPNSAYALFSRLMLQSDVIKSIHPKDRMNYIASKWKTCPEEEQNSYKDQVVHLMEQYKRDYDSYLDSLPEDERRKIWNLSKRKRGRSGRSSPGRARKPRKKKAVKKPEAPKLKFKEPEQPPISACKYFATQYQGEGDPVQAWKTLSSEEKHKYEEELVKKKQAYIVEFEKFLKSLSKEELEAFSKLRQQQAQSDEEDTSDCSSDSEGNDEEEGDDHNEENGDEGHHEEDGHDLESE